VNERRVWERTEELIPPTSVYRVSKCICRKKKYCQW